MNTPTLLLILGAIGALGGLIKGLAGLMLKAEVKSIQARFEVWWQGVSATPKDELPCVILGRVNCLIDQIFGGPLRSRMAFGRSVRISFPLLIFTLLIVAMFSKNQFITTPWISYQKELQTLEKMHDESSRLNVSPEQQQFIDQEYKIACRLNTTSAAAVYSIIFYINLCCVALGGFYSSLVLSRRMLRSLAVTKDRFVIVALIAFALIVTSTILTICMFLIGTVGNPILWLIVFGIILVCTLSLKIALVTILVSGFVTWLLSPISLVLMCFVIFSPLFVSLFILVGAMIANSVPNLFYSIVHRILKLCTEQNPIVIFSGIVVLIGGLLTIIIKCFCWFFLRPT